MVRGLYILLIMNPGGYDESVERTCKVDVPDSVTDFNHTSMFESYVVGCGAKDGCQKDIRLEEIGLCAQNMITNLINRQHICGDLFDHLMSMRIFIFDHK